MNLLIYVGRVDGCFRRQSNYADGMLWDDDENKHHWIERENPTGFTMVLPSNLPSNRCFSGVCYGHEIPLESIRHVSPAQVSGHGCAFVGDVISTIAGGAAAWTKTVRNQRFWDRHNHLYKKYQRSSIDICGYRSGDGDGERSIDIYSKQ